MQSWQGLTKREAEVLALISEGYTDKEIADKLCISLHTVHNHVKNLLHKLKVKNRTEAVKLYWQQRNSETDHQ